MRPDPVKAQKKSRFSMKKLEKRDFFMPFLYFKIQSNTGSVYPGAIERLVCLYGRIPSKRPNHKI